MRLQRELQSLRDQVKLDRADDRHYARGVRFPGSQPRFFRPDFDPFLLLAWLAEVEWTDGPRLLGNAKNLVANEEKEHPKSAGSLVVRAACWLQSMECVQWEGATQTADKQLTEEDFKQAKFIHVTKAGYELLAAHDADQEHFTAAVAPIIVAFSIPTITLLVTTNGWPVEPSNMMRLWLVGLFIASSACLLASFQCTIGEMRRIVSGAVRAVLTYLGLILLWAGLIVLAVPLVKKADEALIVVSIVTMFVLTAVIAVPICLRVREWRRHGYGRLHWADAEDTVGP